MQPGGAELGIGWRCDSILKQEMGESGFLTTPTHSYACIGTDGGDSHDSAGIVDDLNSLS